MTLDYEQLKKSLVGIAVELFRFEKVFEKSISKLETEDQRKYLSQFSWFSKKVNKALEDADLRLVSLEGQEYDPGMAICTLNLEDYNQDERLYVSQMVEPIVMNGDTVVKEGTAILGRIEK